MCDLDCAIISSIVCEALGVSQGRNLSNKQGVAPAEASFRQDIVVEAELVAFSEATDRIDGVCCLLLQGDMFWHDQASFRVLADP